MPRMDAKPKNITSITSQMLKGDPFEPASGDIFYQEGRLAVGEPIPEGWRVLDGNMQDSLVVRVAMRYEIEDAFFNEREKVVEYHAEEMIGLIGEHMVMPCASLKTRMEEGARRARKAIDNA